MIVVDTTALVYAVGAEHRLREPCRSLIEQVASGAVRATTTLEVIQEFVHVRARRRERPDAAALARSYADLFAPLIVLDADDLRAGLTLFEASDVLGAFDAVLAAGALRRDAALVSADRAFATVSGLRHLDPGADDFLAELARTRP